MTIKLTKAQEAFLRECNAENGARMQGWRQIPAQRLEDHGFVYECAVKP